MSGNTNERNCSRTTAQLPPWLTRAARQLGPNDCTGGQPRASRRCRYSHTARAHSGAPQARRGCSDVAATRAPAGQRRGAGAPLRARLVSAPRALTAAPAHARSLREARGRAPSARPPSSSTRIRRRARCRRRAAPGCAHASAACRSSAKASRARTAPFTRSRRAEAALAPRTPPDGSARRLSRMAPRWSAASRRRRGAARTLVRCGGPAPAQPRLTRVRALRVAGVQHSCGGQEGDGRQRDGDLRAPAVCWCALRGAVRLRSR